MKEIKFKVQGSASEPYDVVFIKRDDGIISAYCSCPAGQNDQYCKHRFNILTGKMDGIVSTNLETVNVVASWLSGTDVETALFKVRGLKVEEEEKIKKALSAAKKI
jgi:hypothetical protein